jgi:hypothetical protein
MASSIYFVPVQIYSTLDDWTTGEYKATDFEGKRVQEVYDIHVGLLQRMKGTKPEQYHATMEAIFAKAACAYFPLLIPYSTGSELMLF